MNRRLQSSALASMINRKARSPSSCKTSGMCSHGNLWTCQESREKLRCFTPDKRKAIRAELAHLMSVGFIREVLHSEWLANHVLVLKKNKIDWRMCVDYTDLNKHGPKDPFRLPRID
jgi:hypothetical protein